MPVPPNPYVVYGTVTVDGVLQSGITVTIICVYGEYPITTTTDSSGNYIFDDLAQLPYGYSIGDTVEVSISGASKSFIAGFPEENQIDFNVYNESITLLGSASFQVANIMTMTGSVTLNANSSFSCLADITVSESISLSAVSSVSEMNIKSTTITGEITFAQWLKWRLVWGS